MMANPTKWKGKRKRGYPMNSKYFQEFMDEPTVKEIRDWSVELCAFHRVLPRGLVKRFDSVLGKYKMRFMSYFPDVHPTSGATPLKGRRVDAIRCED